MLVSSKRDYHKKCEREHDKKANKKFMLNMEWLIYDCMTRWDKNDKDN